MFINNFDPVAFEFFSFQIRWYSLSYIFGIILGWAYCKKVLITSKHLSIKFDDYITYVILGIIFGGRLGYIIFYNPIYYLNNLEEIVMLWNGGMSFHGAVIGVIIANYIYIKKNNLEFFIFLDFVSLASPIGIFLGRVANFINSELYGKETDFFLGVKFISIDNLYRHPSQIYESFFEGIVLFILLNFISRKFLLIKGQISALFLIFYSIFRFLIEFTREPDQQLGYLMLNMTMGQMISIVFFIVGLSIFYSKNANK